MPEVLWGTLTIQRDRKQTPQEEDGPFGGFSSLISKAAPAEAGRAQLSPGEKAELGQGARGRSPGKVRRGGKPRARGPTRKFWLLLWLRELCPAGAASLLPGQSSSSDQPSLARAAQLGPAASTPPRPGTPGARPGRADTTSEPGTRRSPTSAACTV